MIIENKSEIDFQEIAAWFRTFYRTSQGYLHIASAGNWSGRFFDLKNGFVRPALYVEQLGRTSTTGIYARVTTVSTPPDEQWRRGGVKLSVALPALWADVDLAGPGHRHDVCPGGSDCEHLIGSTSQRQHAAEVLPLPPDEAAARAIIADALPIVPSLWVHSGGGTYPIWLINPVHTITTDLAEIQNMSSRWQRVIAASAKRAGYHYGAGVGDLARVLRVPGTWNRKTKMARQCLVINNSQANQGHELSELDDALLAAERELPPEPVQITSAPPLAHPKGELRPGDDFIARVDWADYLLLGRLGWRVCARRGIYREWLRADATSSLSATTGRGIGDNLYVFSTETPFPVGVPISKLEAFRIIHGYASHREAARALSRMGFGSPPNPTYSRTSGR